MSEEEKTTRVKSKTGVWRTSIAVLLVVPAIFFWIFAFIIVLTVVLFAFDSEEECNVARIPIQGVLMSTDKGIGFLMEFGAIASADSIIKRIQKANEDETVQAIVFDVDSPGGTPLAGD